MLLSRAEAMLHMGSAADATRARIDIWTDFTGNGTRTHAQAWTQSSHTEGNPPMAHDGAWLLTAVSRNLSDSPLGEAPRAPLGAFRRRRPAHT